MSIQVWVSLAIMTTVFAGCLGDPREEDATREMVTPTESPPATWTIDGSRMMGVMVGIGSPVVSGEFLGSEEFCHVATFDVPVDSLALGVEADGPLWNASEPGVGSFAVTLEMPDGNTVQKFPPREPASFAFESPITGTWSVRLTAVGGAVQHRWTVAISLEGAGTPPSAPANLEAQC